MKEFKDINSILDFAIDQEQQAVDFYLLMADNNKNQAMIDTFNQFAKEEMSHKARLTNIKESGIFTVQTEFIHDLKISDYIVKIEAKPDMTYQEALVLAMQREKSAFKLYQNLAAKAPSQSLKSTFLSLAQEEAKHKLRFEIEYDEYVLREN